MMFYSTNNKSYRVGARDAVMAGLAPDRGLYMPETIPRLPAPFFDSLVDASLHEIGFTVVRAFFGDAVPDAVIQHVVESALDFEIPLVALPTPTKSTLHVLELFHGPTLAFKDVGARFMARLMGHFVQDVEQEIIVLVATSGDTGSAVAHGFHNVPGIKVVVLYPSGKVSALQEAQMTTLGGNVIALEVDGVFDDCQRLVKEAFVDPELTKRLRLTSANSINIARLIPQTLYYFWVVAQLQNIFLNIGGGVRKIVVSVPSGNFGNLTAGLIAKRMGLSINRFIAATNENDVIPEYLESAVFRPRQSIPTISNAMDVGNPSNFARMLELYPDVESMRRDVVGIRINERETRQIIRDVYHQSGYTLDPHGAVAYAALTGYVRQDSSRSEGVFLETAHPAKFKDVVEEETGQAVAIPDRLARCLLQQKKSIKLSGDYNAFKDFLLS